MKKASEVDKFVVLEERLNRILEGYTKLKEEREKLIVRIRGQEEEVDRCKGEVSSLRKERLEVRTRVERLIERLEEISSDYQ